MQTIYKILVYGTLRKGQRAYTSFGLDRQEYLGEVRIPGSIWDLGSFPGLNLDGDTTGVVCDAFDIHEPDVLRRLDGYEGYHPENPAASLYLRRSIMVPEIGEAFIYEYNQQLAGQHGRVESGDWTRR